MTYDRETIKKLIARFQELAARAAVIQQEYSELDQEAAAIRLILSKAPDAIDVVMDEAMKHAFEGQIPIATEKAKLADRILDTLEKFDEPVSPAKIAEVIGGVQPAAEARSLRGKVSAELTKLHSGRNALVVKTGRAQYVLKEKLSRKNQDVKMEKGSSDSPDDP